MLNPPVTLNLAAIDLCLKESTDGEPVVIMRVISHEGYVIDYPMLAVYAEGFAESLRSYAAGEEETYCAAACR
jgi:hypothetical protein